MKDKDIQIRENIGVVYDGDNFPGYLTARQISDIMAGIYQQWDVSLLNRYLEKFQLKSNQKISKYSKGAGSEAGSGSCASPSSSITNFR